MDVCNDSGAILCPEGAHMTGFLTASEIVSAIVSVEFDVSAEA